MSAVIFANRKGGTGKSTLATNVAVCALLAGYRVAVIDTDPQGSVADWARSRANPSPTVVSSTADDLAEALDSFRAEGYDLVFVDTPGTFGHTVESALALCDLAIIPTQPTRLDLKGSLVTARALFRLGKPFKYVLTRCPYSQVRINEAAAILDPLGGIVGRPICSRLDYQDADAKGLGVVEFNKQGRAAVEMIALWTWIAETLGLERAYGAHAAE